MSWASQRRTTYALAIAIFLGLLTSIPLFKYLNRPATCDDGIRNQGETAVDKGGPCRILDENALSPSSVLWARAFEVRDGLYSAAAYIDNPNKDAGVREARYFLGLYDSRNVLIAEREGTTFIMPGSITPVFESGFDTGTRDVARAYLELKGPLTWERLTSSAKDVRIGNREVSGEYVSPRLIASVENISVQPISDLTFIAVIFSPQGNARAASRTSLERMSPGQMQQIIFTWPSPFLTDVGRIDILALSEPVAAGER